MKPAPRTTTEVIRIAHVEEAAVEGEAGALPTSEIRAGGAVGGEGVMVAVVGEDAGESGGQATATRTVRR